MFQGQESRWVLMSHLRIKIYFAALFLATNKESFFFSLVKKIRGGGGQAPWVPSLDQPLII